VFGSNRTGVGGGDLYQKLATGAGSEERIVASDQLKLPSGWSADGRFLVEEVAPCRRDDGDEIPYTEIQKELTLM
jgi:hypothetical protein